MKFSHIVLAALAVVSTSVVGSSAFAKDGTIGPAGCGLGNLLLGGRDMQIFAATLNGTGYQSFGITTGTSNCEQGGKGLVMLNYIQNNKVALEKDIARGQGESIGALAQITGCEEASFSNELKGRYTEIFPGADASTVQITDSIKRVINESPALKTTCAPLT